MRRIIAIVTACLLALSLAGSASATPRDDNGEHKVTVCHATSSAKNPWVVITVDKASTQERAHAKHVHKDGRTDIVFDTVMPDLPPSELCVDGPIGG